MVLDKENQLCYLLNNQYSNAMIKRVSVRRIHREGLFAERPDVNYTEDGF